MNLNEYNALRRVTDAVRAADSAFCEDFYNDEPFTEKTFEPTFPHQHITRLCFLVPGHP